jgi:hypothetical protein
LVVCVLDEEEPEDEAIAEVVALFDESDLR